MIDHTVVVRFRSVPGRWLAGVVVAGAVLAACAPSVDVAVEERAQSPIADSAGDPATPTRPTASDSDPSAPPSTEPPADPSTAPSPDPSTLVWGPCTTFGIPSPTLLGTTHWECSTLDVPMDPFDPAADLPTVTLALTRHPATGARRGTLVLNPGGPGGSGLDAAWGLRSGMPADMLRAYDIVSWDPRGIGASTPPIDCGDDPDVDSPEFMADCALHTGDLAAYLAGPYSAADLAAIHGALGEDRLDYLGYSYGTIIGATFAADHPDQVGHFVLDGATDPLVGGPDGTTDGGFPYYANDGVEAALDRFIELCDQSDACLTDEDTRSVLDELRPGAEALPTDDFAGEPNAVDPDTFDGLIRSALTYAGDWPLLATALGDARDGDASALAAFAADDGTLPPADEEAEASPGPSFQVANLVIYCADFAAEVEGSGFCDPLPRNEHTIEPIRPVDVERPILVIGTEYDPLTPGYHADEFAHALEDAVHVIWEGVGHTAFPTSSSCIDRIVADQFLDGPVAEDGRHCPFEDGVTDDAELADDLFVHDRGSAANWVGNVLEMRGEDADVATCVGGEIAQTDDRTISHVILDVTSAAATDALTAAHSVC